MNDIEVEPTVNSLEVTVVDVESTYEFVTPALIDVTHTEVG